MQTVEKKQRYDSDAAKWDAVRTNDARADGTFVYAVKTTGIYCRPSCASRAPFRENVLFFASADEATASGFRACKRCRPDVKEADAHTVRVVGEACRRIEAAEEAPTLEELAQAANLSPHHFHKLFRRITGVTPKAYAAACRQQKLHAALREEGSVTDSLYAAGFNSSGRFYETSMDMLGMTPSTFRKKGTGEIIRYGTAPCSLGVVLVALTHKGICSILLGDDAASLHADLKQRFANADLLPMSPEDHDVLTSVVALVDDPARATIRHLPLDIRGTAFQRRVWQALRKIPAGKTTTYSEIAQAIGAPEAVRAVAGACAANPFAVAVPCHRVLRKDGSLSGYRWGVGRKRDLLRREKGGSD